MTTTTTTEGTQFYTANPRIPVAGTYNFRDLGGIPLLGGGRIRPGRVFRSDGLHRVDSSGRDRLHRLGVKRIVDLRHDGELAEQPSAVDRRAHEVIHAPVFAAAALERQATEQASVNLADIYRMMIAERGTRLAAAATLVAESPGPVVFHCTAGKDRTGVLAALMLDAVGAQRRAVIVDYAATAQNLAGPWAAEALAKLPGRTAQDGPEPELLELMTASPAPLIARTLESVDEQYGGGAEYLLAHGLSQKNLVALRGRLTR